MALPVIRSGDLFSNYGPDVQSEYFNSVAAADADQVLPEHVFGTNGWQRRLEGSGADPEAANAAFADMWNSMTSVERRNMIEGNAVARRFAGGAARTVADGAFQARLEAAAAISRDPQIGLLSVGSPVGVAERLVFDWLGEGRA